MVSIRGSQASERAPRRPSLPGSTLDNRNVTVAGRRTSIRLEPPMWEALSSVCAREHATINEVVTAIERARTESSLTAAIRVFLLRYFEAAATEGGHWRAGHGTIFARRPPAGRPQGPV
jgi:predicted DNA-binding ribbon-helix-helix protein